MTRWLCIAALVSACGGQAGLGADTSGSTPTVVDTSAVLTAGCARLPCWDYNVSVMKADTFFSGDQQDLRLEGYQWGGFFGGPTLVSETDQEVRLTLNNGSPLAFDLVFPGVDVVAAGTWGPGATAEVRYETTRGPGSYLWRATAQEDARSGMFGLVMVRDPDEFPVLDIDDHRNLIFVDVPLTASETGACGTYGSDSGLRCPAPADADPSPSTVLLGQGVRCTWSCDPAGSRHGGPPNEFLTTSSQRFLLQAGDDLRMTFANLGDTPHTLTLGGLRWTDVHGQVVEAVDIAPGEAIHHLFPGIDQPGEYAFHCVDHDHHGLDRVTVIVQEEPVDG